MVLFFASHRTLTDKGMKTDKGMSTEKSSTKVRVQEMMDDWKVLQASGDGLK